jgi:F-type H+-transporting ATPase subunit alpha
VAVIFLGTNGYLDEIPLEEVRRFEREALETMDARHSDLLATIVATKDLTKDVEERLHAIGKELVAKFKAARRPVEVMA